MKKYFLIVGLVLCYALPAFCQYPSFTRADSLKIENLKRILPGLKGRERVDVLNHLSESYGLYVGFGQFLPKKEIISNIYSYAKEANTEAMKIDYKYGIAKSLLQLATVTEKKDTILKKYLQQAIMVRKDLLIDSLKGQDAVTDHEYEVAKSLLVLTDAIVENLQPWGENDTVTKKCLQKVMSIGEKLHNDSIIGVAYYYLGRLVEDEEMNYKKAISHFQNAGELQQETMVAWQLCAFYSFKGRYEDGFPYCEKFAQLAKENAKKDSSHQADRLVQNSDYYMYEYYNAAGDYETALEYLLKGNNYAVKNNLPWRMELSISELYSKMGKPDSALRYWNLWKKDYMSNLQGLQDYGNLVHADIYIQKSQPDSALPLLENYIVHARTLGKSESGALVKPLLERAEVYKQKKSYRKALQDAREAVEYAEQDNYRHHMMEGYQLLSILYYQLGQFKDAYEALVKYHTNKDSIQSRQFLMRLNNYKRVSVDEKKESALLLLRKDNQIKDAQLKQESTVKNFLIGGLIILIVAGIFIYRSITLRRKTEKLQRGQLENNLKVQQLENEKTQAQLQHQAAELEMRALRAQMNPHFIFNCLSSINRIILRNETQAASDYLTRFSRLIRMVLTNSQRSMIPLEDELQMLRLYLDMERMRFKNSFDYRIIFTNTIDEGSVLVPPLLFQPFCENAIWHGLMQKEGQGHLHVELSMEENVLQCIISDDGIGREKAAELKSKSAEREKSMGLTITAQRLALLNKNTNVETFYTIGDILGENKNVVGTKVILKIAYQEMGKEIV